MLITIAIDIHATSEKNEGTCSVWSYTGLAALALLCQVEVAVDFKWGI